MYSLLNIDGNPKTVKGQKRGYMTAIMYLASGNVSGYEVCPGKTAACAAGCLVRAGRGRYQNVIDARIRRTRLFFEHREVFLRMLENELFIFLNEAEEKGFTPCVRLNGTSDIAWEDFGVPQNFPHVQFYDYTKIFARMSKTLPANYTLIFSRSDCNDEQCLQVLGNGDNVAVVFEDALHPSSYFGYPVVNGDQDDLRFLDTSPVVVALYAKGLAKKDVSGFVVPTGERTEQIEGVLGAVVV